MKRRKFIAGTVAGVALSGISVNAQNKKENFMSPVKVLRGSERGAADYGWLQANYSFSFSRYYDPRRMAFGKLRVFNDDRIAGGGGFPTHPHENFEIITIPLSGAVAHKDTTGGNGVITHGEVQIMSAGSGIQHSEFNHSKSEELRLFQIWIEPEKLNVQPRYAQRRFDVSKRKNKVQFIVAPDERDDSLAINQQAYLSITALDPGKAVEYKLNNINHGVYLMVIEGGIEIEGEILAGRDAAEVTGVEAFKIKAERASEVLIIEVPLT